MCANRVKLSWMRFKRSFLPVLLAVITLAIPRIPSGFAAAADNSENAANTGLLPVPLNMSAMESAEATQSPENASWQDTMNAGIDDMSGQVGQASGMLNLFKTAGEIAGKVDNADQFTKTMQETGKFAEAFGEVFSVISEILDLAKLGMQIYDCVTALMLDDEEVFVEAFNTLVRNLVVSLASEGGAFLGKAVGGLIGSGVASLVTGAIGGVIGRLLGKEGGKLLYDNVLADPVKDLGRDIYDFFRPPDICNDLKYAAFAWGAYDDQDAMGGLLPPDQRAGWKEADTYSKEDGYHATVYERCNDQGEVEEVVVSYRGTDDWDDWDDNLRNFAGDVAPQYNHAAATAKEVLMKYPHAKISFTGHSLGGGLAQYAAAITNLPAITFNPAAPSKLLNIISLDSISEISNRLHDITNYVYAMDPLQIANLISGFTVNLPFGGTWKMGTDQVILGFNMFGGEDGFDLFAGHSMANIWNHFARNCINSDGSSKIPDLEVPGDKETSQDSSNSEGDQSGVTLPPITEPDSSDKPKNPDWERLLPVPKKPDKQEEYMRHKKYDKLVQ